MKASLLIYEDNAQLRECLCQLIRLEAACELLGAFPDVLEVEGQVQGYKPDLILMDVEMPGRDGIEAVRRIRTFDKNVQVIMLTVFEDSAHVFEALCAGANGYLLKKNLSDKLLSSIREVLEGGAPMSPTIARMVIGKMQEVPAREEKSYGLTPREKEILALLAKGNSYKMIAGALAISLETVRTHLKKVYDKLHVNSQVEAVCKAIHEKLV